MSIGFFQIPIPEAARHRFRFMDENGKVFELLRLPMGHRCSPELCQLLLSTLAGLPSHVLPQFKHPGGVRVNIWIDNVHAHGSEEAVVRYFAWLDVQAAACRVTWKPEDSIVGKTYTFIGVQFDHSGSTVAVKGKVIDKLAKAARIAQPTISDVESQLGRLLHVSAVSGLNPAPYYFFLKIMRRRLSLVNRGLASRGDKADLPPSFMAHTLNLAIRQHRDLIRSYARICGLANSGCSWDEPLPFVASSILRDLSRLVKPLLENVPVALPDLGKGQLCLPIAGR